MAIHKNAKINLIEPYYIYFIDDVLFRINDFNPNFLTWNVIKNLYIKNIVFKRIYLEEIYKKLYFKNIGEDINSQNLSTKNKKKISNYEKVTNNMKKNIDFKINNDYSLDISKFIDVKYNFINCLRNSILYDASKIFKKEIDKLKKIDISCLKKAKCLKKDYDKNVINHIKKSINSFLHPSNWIIWNEIDTNKLISLIKDNFNFNKFSKTKNNIEIMENYLKKIKRKLV